MKINADGYLCKRTSKGVDRDWFLPTYIGHSLKISICQLMVPKKYAGKRLRLKVKIEEYDEDN